MRRISTVAQRIISKNHIGCGNPRLCGNLRLFTPRFGLRKKTGFFWKLIELIASKTRPLWSYTDDHELVFTHLAHDDLLLENKKIKKGKKRKKETKKKIPKGNVNVFSFRNT